MKLTNSQLETLMIKTFAELDKTKEACKVTTSQCLQCPDINITNKIIRSCLETGDTCDLCKFFLINKSPNTKNCLAFSIKVLNTTMIECNKLKQNPYCKDMINYCCKTVSDTHKLLKKLHNNI